MSSLPNMSMIARCGSWDGGSGMGGFKRQAPFIIGVAGGTASGKTTVYASFLHIITCSPSPRGLSQIPIAISSNLYNCRCEMIITLLKDQRVAIISQVHPTLHPLFLLCIYTYIHFIIYYLYLFWQT